MMYTVMYYDDAICDDVVAFTGSLDDCRVYVTDAIANYDDGNDFFIVAPDGITVVD